MTTRKRTSLTSWTATCKYLAPILALHCVRNTVIEDYHAQGKISDPEMMDLNKEVVNKLYSVLQILLNPRYSGYREELYLYSPHHWDKPKFDADFLRAMRAIDRRRRMRKGGR
jgi:hypothetical protein